MSKELEIVSCPECWADMEFTGVVPSARYCSCEVYYRCESCDKEVLVCEECGVR